ncbi:MAG: hypothetical protein JNM34_09360, partial [Chthonomonadaceae bacterium]|nr:hypothetical protein [Chthonomonadaceae bacterium]
MKLRPLFSLIVTAAAVAALAQPLNYAQATVEVKAGVLVIPGQQNSAGFALNVAPHLWYNLDQDVSVKPAKWTFVNPFGVTVMTSGNHARWQNLAVDTPAAGTKLTKSSSPYWEVHLDTIPGDQITQYNILSLTIQEDLTVTPVQREKLRRFVDNGGILWVDLVDDGPGLNLDALNPLPFPFAFVGSAAPVDANVSHPLLRFPNPISLSELQFTDYPSGALSTVSQPLPNLLGNVEQYQQWLQYDSGSLIGVAGTNNGSTISVGKIGQGFVVLTSRGVTANLNRGLPFANSSGWNLNRGFYGLKVPADQAFVAAAKLAMNIVFMGGVHTSKDGGPGHRGSNSVDLTAPLLRRFDDDATALSTGGFDPTQQAALFKGRMVVAKNNRLFCYDTRPDRDLDGDGASDDGVENPVGSQSDLIWVTPAIATKLSAPTIVEAPNTALPSHPGGSFRPTDQVWVVDDLGVVRIFNLDSEGATQATLANWPAIGTINPPSGTSNTGGTPMAPVAHESLMFMTDTANFNGQDVGRVWVADIDSARLAVTNGGEWKITPQSRMAPPSAPVTVGYIPIQDGSGGLDRVCYVATRNSTGFSPKPAGLTSVWLGARGESPIRVDYDGPTQSLSVTLRASYFGLPVFTDAGGGTPLKSLGLKFSFVQANGLPVPTSAVNTILGGASSPAQGTNGVLTISGVNTAGYDLDGKQTATPNDDVAIRVDYTVEWGKAGNAFGGPQYENYVRGNLELPDDNRFTREVIGSPALAGDGTVWLVTSFTGGNDPGATLFGLKENKGPGNFTMSSRFELYSRLQFNLNNSTGAADQVDVPPVLTDQDQLVQILPFLNREIGDWRIFSGPTIKGDQVFVMAAGTKAIGFGPAPTGVLMSFKANQPPPSFIIEGTDTNFLIVQPDPCLSLTKNQPEQSSLLQAGQFTVEPIPGTTQSRVILNSLMNVQRGRVRDSISMSLPVIVRRGGQTDTLIEPEAITDNGRMIAGKAGGKWNPLDWYMVFNGYRPGAGPIVSGQTLYQGGASVLPGIFAGNGFFTFNGLVFALDATVSPNDEFLRSNTDRPWTRQLNSFLSNSNSFADIRPCNAVKWPQFRGIQDMDDLRIRILQATIEEDGVTTIAGGDDSLAICGPNSVYGFSRSDFTVVDSGRISRIDPSGNPIWATDQTMVAGKQGPTTSFGNAKQLSEPNRMYSAGDSGYWVVDTGNNRVVRVDASSRETRTVEKFKLDPVFQFGGVGQGAPAGVSTGESLQLRRPKDVLVFETVQNTASNPFSNPQQVERWVHMVVADSGNNRIVELVDRYRVDPLTGRSIEIVKYEDPPGSGQLTSATGVLYWHTPEELTGRDYRYNSIARTIQDVGGQRHNVVA